jgi:hypothetical protein
MKPAPTGVEIVLGNNMRFSVIPASDVNTSRGIDDVSLLKKEFFVS